jgi:putative tryptophan/tyrosine transport system substrate-binding protein
MLRREFITLLGGAAAWPRATRAQGGMPVIGFMHTASADRFTHLVSAFRTGLKEVGYIEGQNVVIEYRWAEGQYDRLPKFAADLVARQVSVFAATGGDLSGLAAKATNTTIPIVFEVGGDPIQLGLVASLNRPGGNLTGTTLLSAELAPKRLELLHDLVPKAINVALLVNPTSPDADAQAKELQAVAPAVGMQVQVFQAGNDSDLDDAFAAMAERNANALVLQADPFFTNRRDRLVSLANRHAIPAMYPFREFATAGGLMTYGADIAEVFRETGVYTGRILRGQSPADLPVLQPTKFDLVLNLKAAKALGITVPLTLQMTANDVIE